MRTITDCRHLSDTQRLSVRSIVACSGLEIAQERIRQYLPGDAQAEALAYAARCARAIDSSTRHYPVGFDR